MCRRLVWIQFANTYIPNHDEDDGVDDDVVDNDGLPLALKTYIDTSLPIHIRVLPIQIKVLHIQIRVLNTD